MKRKLIGIGLLCIGAATFLVACSKNAAKKGKGEGVSRVTSWPLNDKNWGGFQVMDYQGQQTPVGMVFVQGGRFTMGATDDEMPTLENNSMRRTVSVSSFYMDECEVANIWYREYIYWLGRVYGSDYQNIIQQAMPDSSVWRSALSYNEPYVKNYFWHNAYNYYPVVGVNWYQANDFCQWRTDRVNEFLLIRTNALKTNVDQSGEDVFTTETYMVGQYEGTKGKNIRADLDKNGSGERPWNKTDGVFLPDYRLPTEAEWEYAALGLIGNNPSPENKRRRGEEVVTDRNTIPWGPKNTTRYGLHNQYQGEFEGNFMRAKGDAMGVAGGLNDNADVTAPVKSYLPNAFGLYNMAGNVNEWVMDTYRPSSHEDVNEFRPFRGNIYTHSKVQDDGTLEEKDSIGHIPIVNVTSAELLANGRYETRTGDLSSYKDGDTLSQFTYAYGLNTLINDSTKVYKGGSWADRAYWMSPGTRRYMQGNLSSCTIGFRCVMDRLGSPDGDQQPGGNSFGNQKRHKR
ncbi:MAG: SUMF1/EgtB/PvdO family nonheme iron enzyme [Chitinophagales bacterium]